MTLGRKPPSFFCISHAQLEKHIEYERYVCALMRMNDPNGGWLTEREELRVKRAMFFHYRIVKKIRELNAPVAQGQ